MYVLCCTGDVARHVLVQYVRVYYADNSHNLSIQSHALEIRLIRSELFINFVVFPGKVLTFPGRFPGI